MEQAFLFSELLGQELQEPVLSRVPQRCQRGQIWRLGRHHLMCGNSSNGAEVDMLLQDEKPDLIFADPPYGIGIDAWDKAIEDVPLFIELVTRNLKQGGFFAFTHQMPYMIDWLVALGDSALKYKDHIAWVKRLATTPGAALTRGHENLFIYGHGKARYYTTKGRYTDVKVPGLLFDTASIESIQVYINDLHLKLQGDVDRRIRRTHQASHSPNYKGYQGIPLTADRSPEYVNFTNVWSFSPEHHLKVSHASDRHPTAKPALLLERLITLCTPEQATVYDAFLGSGMTLIAGHRTGRTVYGMELSPEYCDGILYHWEKITGQQAILYN